MAAVNQNQNKALSLSLLAAEIIVDLLQEDSIDDDDDSAITLLFNEGSRQNAVRINEYTESVVTLYTDTQFKEFFRLRRDSFEDVLVALRNDVTIPTPENHFTGGRIPVELRKQLLITLWYMSNQSFIRDISDRFDVTKSSVKRITTRIIKSLSCLSNEFIKWPTGDYKDLVMDAFAKMKGIKGVIGLIDGTHIEIPKRSIDTLAYINRKGYSSIIMQGICDHRLKFTNINVGFPGSVHDARVLRRSKIYEAVQGPSFLEMFPNESFLLRDPAYPCLPWLIGKKQKIF